MAFDREMRPHQDEQDVKSKHSVRGVQPWPHNRLWYNWHSLSLLRPLESILFSSLRSVYSVYGLLVNFPISSNLISRFMFIRIMPLSNHECGFCHVQNALRYCVRCTSTYICCACRGRSDGSSCIQCRGPIPQEPLDAAVVHSIPSSCQAPRGSRRGRVATRQRGSRRPTAPTRSATLPPIRPGPPPEQILPSLSSILDDVVPSRPRRSSLIICLWVRGVLSFGTRIGVGNPRAGLAFRDTIAYFVFSFPRPEYFPMSIYFLSTRPSACLIYDADSWTDQEQERTLIFEPRFQVLSNWDRRGQAWHALCEVLGAMEHFVWTE